MVVTAGAGSWQGDKTGAQELAGGTMSIPRTSGLILHAMLHYAVAEPMQILITPKTNSKQM